MTVFRLMPEFRISHSFLTSSPGGRPGAGYLLLRGQKKLTEEKAALASRAFTSLALLDGFGVSQTRSICEKTHKSCELKQVLDHGTEHACVTQRLTRVLRA